MKFFQIFCNNGNWNGNFKEYVIANSLDDAKEIFKDKIAERLANGYDITLPKEVSGEDLLLMFGLYYLKDKYDVKYKISERK